MILFISIGIIVWPNMNTKTEKSKGNEQEQLETDVSENKKIATETPKSTNEETNTNNTEEIKPDAELNNEKALDESVNSNNSTKTNTQTNTQQEETPTAEQPLTPTEPTTESPQTPQIVVGIDWNLTNTLKSMVVDHTTTYTGIKKDELTEMSKRVALGEQSENTIINKINQMTWEESGTLIDSFLPSEIGKITPFDVKCTKFTVDGTMLAENISSTCNFNLGQFSSVFAYRNSDNTVTITSLGASFMVSQIQ